jgi:hypothetical protein
VQVCVGPVTWEEPPVRRPGAGARTWLPLRAESEAVEEELQPEESVEQGETRCKQIGQVRVGGVTIEKPRGWNGARLSTFRCLAKK